MHNSYVLRITALYIGLLNCSYVIGMLKIIDDSIQFGSDDTAAVKFILQNNNKEGYSVGMKPTMAPPQSLLTFRDKTQSIREEKVLLRAIPGEDSLQRVVDTTTYPYSSIAHANNNKGSGSGCMVGPHHFLTAAHCVYDRATGSFVNYFAVYCGLNDGVAPFNVARGVRIYIPEEYTKTGNENYDIALVVLDQSIGNKVGWVSFYFNEETVAFDNKKINITGYPGDKGDGKQMWGMTHNVKTITPDKFYYEHDTFSGHSGSPITWERVFDSDGTGVKPHTQIVDVHTHGEGPFGTGN